MPPADLEPIVHHALRRLPPPRAPHTLLPRVLAAARAWAGRPWYSRAWLTWPLGWQAASLAAFALLIGLGVWMAPAAGSSLDAAIAAVPADRVAPVVDTAREVARDAERASAVAQAVWLAWRSVMLPGVLYGFVLLGLMCAACAAFLTMVSRLAFERVTER